MSVNLLARSKKYLNIILLFYISSEILIAINFWKYVLTISDGSVLRNPLAAGTGGRSPNSRWPWPSVTSWRSLSTSPSFSHCFNASGFSAGTAAIKIWISYIHQSLLKNRQVSTPIITKELEIIKIVYQRNRYKNLGFEIFWDISSRNGYI